MHYCVMASKKYVLSDSSHTYLQQSVTGTYSASDLSVILIVQASL